MTQIDPPAAARSGTDRPWEDGIPQDDRKFYQRGTVSPDSVPVVPPPLCCVSSAPRDQYHDLDVPLPKGKNVQAARREYRSLIERIATYPDHRKRSSWIFHARELVRTFGRKRLNVRPTTEARQARQAALYVQLVRAVAYGKAGEKQQRRVHNAESLATKLGRNLAADIQAYRAGNFT